MKKLTSFAQICIALLFVLITITELQAQDTESEKGNLIYIISDYVSPSNLEEYEQWIKEFKVLADETGFPNYAVSQSDEGMGFFMNIGKTWSGFDELEKSMEEWFPKNPKAMELEKKYGHTRNYSKNSLWRHSPLHSYTPESYDASIERNYMRISLNWIKSGHMEKAKEILAEYKATWTAAGISSQTNGYWNVFGEELSCIGLVTAYESREAWVNSRKEIFEKIGEPKLMELRSKWMSVLRKREESELYGRPELAHWVQP